MSYKRFDLILGVLAFTDKNPHAFADPFWEVRQKIDAWQTNMNVIFSPGFMNCLDESMSVWTNMFTCPGFMFVQRKPWPFGNEYHTACCCSRGIMWGIELVEGEDWPPELGQQEYGNLGTTVGLLLCLLVLIFHLSFVLILDSSFCVMRKKGVLASALIKNQ